MNMRLPEIAGWRPRRAVGDNVSLHRFKAGAAGVRHDQLAVVIEQEKEIARFDHRGIRRGAGRTQPEGLACGGVHAKN